MPSVVGPDGTQWPAGSLRGLEHKSIRDFVQLAADEGYLSGRVLDYGCGKQPYRAIVEDAGGEYEGFDLVEHPANVSGEDIGEDLLWDANAWDAILCNQVVQYVPFEYVTTFFDNLKQHLFTDGFLVMTYATNWPEVEPEDLHRFTKSGMERLLTEAGFEIVKHEWRALAARAQSGEAFATGYGVIARA